MFVDIPTHGEAADLSGKHHEEAKSFQQKFVKDVLKLEQTFLDLTNPFADRTDELINIKTKDVASAEVITSIKTMEKVGSDMYQKYMEVLKGVRSVNEPYPLVGLPLFATKKSKKGKDRASHELELAKYNCNTFSKLFMACQVRQIDLHEFFSCENHVDPPSLAFDGQMRSGTKANILDCIITDDCLVADVPDTVTAIMIDGAALMNMITPDAGSTFDRYANKIQNHLEIKLRKVSNLS